MQQDNKHLRIMRGKLLCYCDVGLGGDLNRVDLTKGFRQMIGVVMRASTHLHARLRWHITIVIRYSLWLRHIQGR